MHIGLISAGYPPDLDGIGDYTWWLAKALAEAGHAVTVFTRMGPSTPLPGVTVVPFFAFDRPDSFRSLPGKLAETSSLPDWIVLQYNPFCWGRRGYCPAVPATLRTLRRGSARTRVAVMFHETTVPRWPWRFAVMRTWQRWLLRGICAEAESLFVSTARWIPQLQTAGARVRPELLPVGPNVPRSLLTREEARAKFGLGEGNCPVIGLFGAAHASRQLDWIGGAVRALRVACPDLLVLHVGPDAETFREACHGVAFRSEGVLPAEAAADCFRAMDGLVAPFVDGMSTRRTSVISPLWNGVPVATTRRPWTDALFDEMEGNGMLLSRAASAPEFAADVVAWWRGRSVTSHAEVESFCDRYLGWDRIGEALVDSLQSGGRKTFGAVDAGMGTST